VQFSEGQGDLPEFYRDYGVEVICSLPCYLEENCDTQRGRGVYEKSIAALRRLNAVGYGRGDGLHLHLVYNPVGTHLPPAQAELEEDYKRELAARFGIVFDRLYTITNVPISRWLRALRREGELDRYMELLVQSFNPATVEGLMCRHMVSISWDGRLYDCDFHQMAELPLAGGLPRTIAEFDPALLANRRIVTAPHCFACTAGSGSSCGGALTGAGL
jgi:radical SAM/Cys-rich protein